MSFKVKAIYEYSSPHEDDLNFGVGQIITITEEEDDDWYNGEYVDASGVKHEGIFPRNFVEKYEPVAPPRPIRTRPKKEPELPHEVPAAVPEDPAEELLSPREVISEPVAEPSRGHQPASPPRQPAEPRSPIAASPPSAPRPAEPELPASPPQAPREQLPTSPPRAAPVRSGPPPAAPKPTSNSFKDRIAAFNKAAAPPIAPFKPSGLGPSNNTSNFIKKPFVAPPPKGNTYVPVQRNTPVAPVYRRDEDPEIREREAENAENAQKAGLLPSESKEDGDEDQPKPLSLKERMALLQKQQQEQAQRHAEAAAKREKPKRPAAKPRMPSQDASAERADEEGSAAPPVMDRKDSVETGSRRSVDEPHPPRVPAQPRRKPSHSEPRDGNEADMSGAGETTDNQEEVTERDDSDEKPRHSSRPSTAGLSPAEEEAEEAGEDDEEEEEEDEEAKEFRRKEELRARMARLGGGMGMPGMFGMPMPGAATSLPPKQKKAASSEKRTSEDSQSVTSPGHAPPVPMMMALPGLGLPRRVEEQPAATEDSPAVAEEVEEEKSVSSPPAGKSNTVLPGSKHVANVPAVPTSALGAPPPIPGGRAAPPVPSEGRTTHLAFHKTVLILYSTASTTARSCGQRPQVRRL